MVAFATGFLPDGRLLAAGAAGGKEDEEADVPPHGLHHPPYGEEEVHVEAEVQQTKVDEAAAHEAPPLPLP